MRKQTADEARKSLIHLLNSGTQPREAAQELGRSRSWAYKWKNRYEEDGWVGLQSRSRAPKHVPNRTHSEVCEEIFRVRSQLKANAANKDSLGYIGAYAIYGRLDSDGIAPLHAVSTIERILHQAGRTKPRLPQMEKAVEYPHLKPTAAHQLTQVDIVPRYLTGG